MTPPLNKQRKFAFRLKYSTTTTKNKETLHFFDRFIYKVLRIQNNYCEDIKVIILRNINSTLLIRYISLKKLQFRILSKKKEEIKTFSKLLLFPLRLYDQELDCYCVFVQNELEYYNSSRIPNIKRRFSSKKVYN